MEHDHYFHYLSNRKKIARAYLRLLVYPRISKHLVGQTLDVGCGVGDFLEFRPGSVGVDVNPLLVEHCRNRGLRVYPMPYDVLPFDGSSFDSLVLDNVLEHIAEPVLLIKEMKRVLRTNGVLVVGVPGEKGFLHDQDHKVFYDLDRLISTFGEFNFKFLTMFGTPFLWRKLSKLMRQYCIYCVLENRHG